MTRSVPDWQALRGGISGEVVLPGSSDYEAARKPAITSYHDLRPLAVVLCETSRTPPRRSCSRAGAGSH